jgi:arabinogalactan endo-1,4-beta-galactosidase
MAASPYIMDMIRRLGSEVMLCEVGMDRDKAVTAKLFLRDLLTQTSTINNKKCLGVFCREPEAFNGWKGYGSGAFDNSGKPTTALEAFGHFQP